MAERYYARDDRKPGDVPGGIEATVVDRLRPDVVDGISGFAIVCYCQNFEDAERIVAALNAPAQKERV